MLTSILDYLYVKLHSRGIIRVQRTYRSAMIHVSDLLRDSRRILKRSFLVLHYAISHWSSIGFMKELLRRNRVGNNVSEGPSRQGSIVHNTQQVQVASGRSYPAPAVVSLSNGRSVQVRTSAINEHKMFRTINDVIGRIYSPVVNTQVTQARIHNRNKQIGNVEAHEASRTDLQSINALNFGFHTILVSRNDRDNISNIHASFGIQNRIQGDVRTAHMVQR